MGAVDAYFWIEAWDWQGPVEKRPWMSETANNGVKQEVDKELDI